MIKVHSIDPKSYTNGPGERVVLFLQGCPIHCPGCQNAALWNPDRGIFVDEGELAVTLAWLARKNGGNVTISGGEPFAQPAALAYLLRTLRETPEIKNVILYTGYTWEDLITHATHASLLLWLSEILGRIDVLVDGPFLKDYDDNFITYRGSRNQRAIDVPATLQAGHLVLLNWDSPEIVITTEGNIVLPAGLASEFAEIGQPAHIKMCGENASSRTRTI